MKLLPCRGSKVGKTGNLGEMKHLSDRGDSSYNGLSSEARETPLWGGRQQGVVRFAGCFSPGREVPAGSVDSQHYEGLATQRAV